jgi:hypothetical protein
MADQDFNHYYSLNINLLLSLQPALLHNVWVQ